MLDLSDAAPLEGFRVAVLAQASWVPITDRGLHAQLALESAQRRVRVVRPVAPCAASQTILEKHPDDRHHRQPAVGDLRVQLLRLRFAIEAREQGRLPAHVAGSRLALANVIEAKARSLTVQAVDDDLKPPEGRHLGDGCQAVGYILESEALRRAEVPWELASHLRRNVTHSRQHGDPAVLDLGGATALEGLSITVLREASGVPKANWGLNSQLRLECAQRGARVERPVAPGGACQ